jgi:hypothetical protein
MSTFVLTIAKFSQQDSNDEKKKKAEGEREKATATRKDAP